VNDMEMRKMPCKPCPEGTVKTAQETGKQGSVVPQPSGAVQDHDVIADPELRRIWRAVRDLQLSIRFFRFHLTNVSCERCKELAGELVKLLDSYSRLLVNAENYKYERMKLVPGIQKLAEQFGVKLEEFERKEDTQ